MQGVPVGQALHLHGLDGGGGGGGRRVLATVALAPSPNPVQAEDLRPK